jgi:hypothetical protein
LFNQPVPIVYRLAPSLVVRLTGAALLATALAVLVATVVTATTGAGPGVILVVAVLGLAAVAGVAWWASRGAYVVRLDQLGYQVRLVRGAGVTRARWADVAEASTAQLRGTPCVVLALRDGRTTTVPTAALAADRDEFVAEVRKFLRHGR